MQWLSLLLTFGFLFVLLVSVVAHVALLLTLFVVVVAFVVVVLVLVVFLVLVCLAVLVDIVYCLMWLFDLDCFFSFNQWPIFLVFGFCSLSMSWSCFSYLLLLGASSRF